MHMIYPAHPQSLGFLENRSKFDSGYELAYTRKNKFRGSLILGDGVNEEQAKLSCYTLDGVHDSTDKWFETVVLMSILHIH